MRPLGQTNPVEPLGLRESQAAAATLGIEIQPLDLRTAEDYAAAFAAITSNRSQALLAHGNPINFRSRQRIAEFALGNRMPSVYEARQFIEAGGLMSYAANSIDLARRAAGYVDRIVKGAKPSDLPVEQREFTAHDLRRQTLAATIERW